LVNGLGHRDRGFDSPVTPGGATKGRVAPPPVSGGYELVKPLCGLLWHRYIG
jgi:hypothetical protein